LSKLKKSGDERSMRREVVRQIKIMQMKGRMGKKWEELKGGPYHMPPPFCLHPL